MVIVDRTVLFRFVEFLELYHIVQMLMLDKIELLFRDHMFEGHLIYVMYQHRQHRPCIRSNQTISKWKKSISEKYVWQNTFTLT